MSKPLKYYWYVKTYDEKVWLHADWVSVTNGILTFFQEKEGEDWFPILSFASGEWEHFYAASCFSGGPVHVEHWDKLDEDEEENEND